MEVKLFAALGGLVTIGWAVFLGGVFYSYLL